MDVYSVYICIYIVNITYIHTYLYIYIVYIHIYTVYIEIYILLNQEHQRAAGGLC